MNNKESIKNAVYLLIAKHSIPPIDVTRIYEDTSLIEELGYDLLGLMELKIAIEHACKIKVVDADLFIDNFSTPLQIINFIESMSE